MSDYSITFERRPNYLFVKGTGARKTLQAVFESGKEFGRIAEETKSKFILLDYSELTTIISNTDIFNITRLYESAAPLLHELCVSIIINPLELHLEKFWEDICRKRGFNFKIFIDPIEAETWLLGQAGIANARV